MDNFLSLKNNVKYEPYVIVVMINIPDIFDLESSLDKDQGTRNASLSSSPSLVLPGDPAQPHRGLHNTDYIIILASEPSVTQ